MAFCVETEDGEWSHLELKAVMDDLATTKKSQMGDFKLRIGKEMSAFSNTDAGVIAIGMSKERKVVNAASNLLYFQNSTKCYESAIYKGPQVSSINGGQARELDSSRSLCYSNFIFCENFFRGVHTL